jgi:excisionase family DNA binding protein
MLEPVPVLLPVKGICKHFGLSPATVNRWLAAGLIESVKLGRSRLIYVASVYAYLDTKRD